MTTKREKTARRSLKLLGTDRFIAFIQAIQSDRDCFAVKLMKEALNGGDDLNNIFFTNNKNGYLLSVSCLDDHLFRIEFGCQADPLAGDGGEWFVQFEPDGRVTNVTEGSMWVS
jgi:hypothetical protein